MQDINTLVEQVKRGNSPDAFTQLYGLTVKKAYFTVAHLVPKDDIADVLQEGYIAAFNSIKTFDSSKSFEAWLHTIVRNKAIDFLRKDKPALFVDDEAMTEVADDDELSIPAVWYDVAEKRGRMMQLIDSLPEKQRVVVVLYYYEGFSVTEVAELLEVAKGTVQSRLYTARQEIKRLVLEEEKKGNKLYGVIAVPVLSAVYKLEQANAIVPEALSQQVISGVLASVKSTAAATTGGTLLTKFVALSIGVKASIIGLCGALVVGGAAVTVYSLQKPTFDIAPISTAITSLADNYTASIVVTDNLVNTSKELAHLNAQLMLETEFENEDTIKAVLTEADAIINRIDLDDPLIQVENKEQATTALSEVQKSLGMAMTHYGVAKAAVLVERVDIGTGTIAGTVGDTMSITPYLYPTFAEHGVLDWVSTDEAVATVTEDGDITMTGAGTATIILTETLSDVSSSITVTVEAPVVAPPVTAPATSQAPSQAPQVSQPTQQTQQSSSTGSSGPEYAGEYTKENVDKLHEEGAIGQGEIIKQFDDLGADGFAEHVGGLKWR